MHALVLQLVVVVGDGARQTGLVRHPDLPDGVFIFLVLVRSLRRAVLTV